VYWKLYLNFIWFVFEFGFENEIGKKLEKGKLTLSTAPVHSAPRSPAPLLPLVAQQQRRPALFPMWPFFFFQHAPALSPTAQQQDSAA